MSPISAVGPLGPGSGHDVQTLWLDAAGARLQAWLVVPQTPAPWPLVVMSHGWAAVKEMNLDYFAAAMSAAGIAALVFDHRGFGGSRGLRGDIDPGQQIADYQFALSVGAQLDGIDPARLAVWGTSFSGGHVLCLAAHDTRIKAAVAQVPTISGSESMRRRRGDQGVLGLRREWAEERRRLNDGYPPQYALAADIGDHEVPGSVGPETSEPITPELLPVAPTALYRDDERWRFYVEMPLERRLTWRNRVTLESWERYAAYEPGLAMGQLQAPLLVIYANADSITPTDLIRDAIDRASGQVQVLQVPGGHYAVYAAHRERAADAAARFLSARLCASD